MDRTIGYQALVDRLTAILMKNGLVQKSALIIAGRMAASARDGVPSHGVLRLPAYLAALAKGWVDSGAVPSVEDRGPAVLVVDAANGFAQVALAAGEETLIRKARDCGLAVMAIRRCYHIAALWPDLEPFAERGFVALTFRNARSRILVWDADTKLLGTNPMAFASPRADGPPFIFDLASSVVAQGELLIAAREGRLMPEGTGRDAAGQPTRDPNGILDGGSMHAFGGHKGSAIALMVEIMAAALTGGQFGYEHDDGGAGGARPMCSGQYVLLIDPERTAGGEFAQRVESLIQAIVGSGVSRLPGTRRYEHRQKAERDGVPLSHEDWELLNRC